MSDEFERLSLTELIRLQNHLSEVVRRRFERPLAIAFSDIVGSTAYFARFGDEAGRRLQQRHFDLVERAIGPAGGRVVDTAGDGAFLAFPTAEKGAEALVALEIAATRDNATHPPEHQLAIRVGMHWGPVLTDGVVVSGDSVNLCSRVTATAVGGEIRITRPAFLELPNAARLRCRALAAVRLKGIADPVEVMSLEWRDRSAFPGAARVEETGEVIVLPEKDTITFGRLKEMNGAAANDIVLSLADPKATQQLSRWHFELRRTPSATLLRAVSTQPTEVDGLSLAKGQEAIVKTGSVVRLSKVMTLVLLPGPDESGETVGPG